jgi:hypothetical protein
MTSTRSNPPQSRDETGRFLAGQSGNPGGRPVGFHNYIQERTSTMSIYAHELKEDFEQVREAMAKFA